MRKVRVVGDKIKSRVLPVGLIAEPLLKSELKNKLTVQVKLSERVKEAAEVINARLFALQMDEYADLQSLLRIEYWLRATEEQDLDWYRNTIDIKTLNPTTIGFDLLKTSNELWRIPEREPSLLNWFSELMKTRGSKNKRASINKFFVFDLTGEYWKRLTNLMIDSLILQTEFLRDLLADELINIAWKTDRSGLIESEEYVLYNWDGKVPYPHYSTSDAIARPLTLDRWYLFGAIGEWFDFNLQRAWILYVEHHVKSELIKIKQKTKSGLRIADTDFHIKGTPARHTQIVKYLYPILAVARIYELENGQSVSLNTKRDLVRHVIQNLKWTGIGEDDEGDVKFVTIRGDYERGIKLTTAKAKLQRVITFDDIWKLIEQLERKLSR